MWEKNVQCVEIEVTRSTEIVGVVNKGTGYQLRLLNVLKRLRSKLKVKEKISMRK